jgi:hypothetical protein
MKKWTEGNYFHLPDMKSLKLCYHIRTESLSRTETNTKCSEFNFPLRFQNPNTVVNIMNIINRYSTYNKSKRDSGGN